MIFYETRIKGVYVLEAERFEDERGFFSPSFSQREFAAHGLASSYVEHNLSFNLRRGTLRGLHYQAPPYAEVKLVRCTARTAFDVVVDIRLDSPTFKEWLGVELSAKNRKMLYIPEGFAHGFQTLEDHTELFYQMSKAYVPNAARGIRWDDPDLHITWPLQVTALSTSDAAFPTLSSLLHSGQPL